MTFFRVVLCLAGVLLYLIVRELSPDDATLPVGPNLLEPMPAPQLTVVTSPLPQWPGPASGFSAAGPDKPLP
jgi:hypothetical protein